MEKQIPEQPLTDGKVTLHINQLTLNLMKESKDGMMDGTLFGQSLTEKKLSQKWTNLWLTNNTTDQELEHQNSQMEDHMDFKQMTLQSDQTHIEI